MCVYVYKYTYIYIQGLGLRVEVTAAESATDAPPPPPAPDEEGGAEEEGGSGRVERAEAERGGAECTEAAGKEVVEVKGMGAPGTGWALTIGMACLPDLAGFPSSCAATRVS